MIKIGQTFVQTRVKIFFPALCVVVGGGKQLSAEILQRVLQNNARDLEKHEQLSENITPKIFLSFQTIGVAELRNARSISA